MPIVDGSLDRLMPKTLHIPSVASKKAAYILTLQPKKVKFFIVKKSGWCYTVQKLSNQK